MKDLKERGDDDESSDGFEETHIVILEQDMMIFNQFNNGDEGCLRRYCFLIKILSLFLIGMCEFNSLECG
ncbi:hypothetical protein QVD17_17881 [Tagetes erecta]|uniref:Uncharacterized protein n=1 Tax=Tagetes erecta TaxID=13708 RepID=A0AAD8NVN1_TARER|nr:hypothetical protein QVD17_17881 [Tagetes erecta]